MSSRGVGKRFFRLALAAALLWRENFNEPAPSDWPAQWIAWETEAAATASDERDALALHALCTRIRRRMEVRLQAARAAASKAVDELVAADTELLRWMENELIAAQRVIDTRTRDGRDAREADRMLDLES